jgi:hypothetical protein
VTIRPATPADATELVRLRAVLLRTFDAPGWNDDWREPARKTLTELLGRPESPLGAFVADRPDGSGLAACALGSNSGWGTRATRTAGSATSTTWSPIRTSGGAATPGDA